jgi:hypothetical protein
MTIDKFGRSSKSSSRDVKGPKGEGFNVTADGHYDMQEKRLTNLGVSVESRDAVTKEYVDSKVITLETDGFNLRQKRMRNLDDAKDEGDAVNLKTLKRICLTRWRVGFNADRKRIFHVGDPKDPKDAATKLFVESTCKEEVSPLGTRLDKQQQDLNGLIERIGKCETSIASIETANNGVIERIGKCETTIGSNKTDSDKEFKKLAIILFKYVHRRQTGRSAVIPDEIGNWEDLFTDKEYEEENNVHPLPPNSYNLFVAQEEPSETFNEKKSNPINLPDDP